MTMPFVRDRSRAVYFEPGTLHYDPFQGDHFKIRGPLNMARPPQGYPVFAQAGASDAGKDFAARIAEIVFTPLHTLQAAQTFSRDMKARAVSHGRDPADLKIMPGLNAIVGRTDEEAEETYQLLQSRIHPDVGRASFVDGTRRLRLLLVRRRCAVFPSGCFRRLRP